MSPALVLLSMVAAGSGFGSFGGTGSKGGGGTSAIVRPATVGWYGDSLTAGACSGTTPPAALDALLPAGYVVANKGVSGETAHEISARAQSGSATACVGEPCGHYVVQGAVNTLKSATYNASSAASVAQAALHGASNEDSGTCNTAVANACGTMDTVDFLRTTHSNARIFVIGVLPYAGCNVATCPDLVEPGGRALAYNAALQAECSSRPWLTCLLLYEDFEDPETADDLLPAYRCADGLHLVDAGSAALASAVFEASTW